MKKGQGMSLNVIIIASLALLTLVVLAVIFLQNTMFTPPTEKNDSSIQPKEALNLSDLNQTLTLIENNCGDGYGIYITTHDGNWHVFRTLTNDGWTKHTYTPLENCITGEGLN